MNMLLFSGFLGSGKTSVIVQLARYLTGLGKTVAIVENEIGETGIDDQLLAQQGLSVRGIFAGCVCCQVTGDLMVAIREIKNTLQTDWLIIEATGLANPEPIVRSIETYCVDVGQLKTVTIVDAERWQELFEIVENLMIAQIQAAQFVLLNKADLVTAAESAQLSADLHLLSPAAKVLTAAAAQTLPSAVLEELLYIC